jgi:hypothetical protein
MFGLKGPASARGCERRISDARFCLVPTLRPFVQLTLPCSIPQTWEEIHWTKGRSVGASHPEFVRSQPRATRVPVTHKQGCGDNPTSVPRSAVGAGGLSRRSSTRVRNQRSVPTVGAGGDRAFLRLPLAPIHKPRGHRPRLQSDACVLSSPDLVGPKGEHCMA